MLEYMDCSLQYLLQCRGALPLCNVKSYTHQVLQALKYTKSKRVMHRDLKPANILVNLEEGVVKLADFGLSRLHEQGGRYSRQVLLLRTAACARHLTLHTAEESCHAPAHETVSRTHVCSGPRTRGTSVTTSSLSQWACIIWDAAMV